MPNSKEGSKDSGPKSDMRVHTLASDAEEGCFFEYCIHTKPPIFGGKLYCLRTLMDI